MIIDQLNTELTGGASVAAARLHQVLRSLGIESRLWCARLPPGPAKPGSSVLSFGPSSKSPRAQLSHWIRYIGRKVQWRIDKQRYLKGRSATLERFTVPWLPYGTPFDSQVLSGDVLQLHWITKFVDLASFFGTVPDDHPTVWTLHDMSAFTGGCHHADGCLRFTSDCGSCPQLMQAHPEDLSWRALKAKRAALENKNLHIVTPSRWLERLVRQSRVMANARSVQTIYNGLDVRQFAPRDQRRCRRELGLPEEGLIVAFGAAWLPNRRKGLVEYLRAMCHVATQVPVLGLVFGDGEFPQEVQPTFPIRRVGFLSEPDEQCRVYSAADVFVLSSLGENLAQTGVESLACGTPVVCFDVGGLPEYVRPGETGLLAELGDTEKLARQILWMLRHPDERRQMSQAGRKLVEREFDHIRQAGKYVALYQSLASAAARAA